MKLICTDYNYYSGVKEKQEREFIYYKQSNKQTQTKRERKPGITTAIMKVC